MTNLLKKCAGLAAMGILVLAQVSCQSRNPAGMGYSAPVYWSENVGQYTATKEAFKAWIKTQGLTPCAAPGATPTRSNTQLGDIDGSWYQMPVNQNLLMICVITHDTAKQIQIEMSYNGMYTPEELTEMKQSNVSLWSKIFDWFEADSAKDGNCYAMPNMRPFHKDAKHYFGDMLAQIQKSYESP